MTFDYDMYYRQNCVLPIIFLLGAIYMIGSLFVHWFDNNNSCSKCSTSVRIFSLCIFLFLLVVNVIPLARGGLFLLIEKEKDSEQIIGTIEETIEIGSLGGAKYRVEQNRGYGEAIVVDGRKYYLVTYGNFQIGDNVTLEVLPRSRFVLQIECSK